MVNGQRIREAFKTREEADERAAQIRIEHQNLGNAAFEMPMDLRVEASRCASKLKPYDVTITEAVTYYIDRVLRFRVSPTVDEAVKKLIHEKSGNGRRPRTITDMQSRLGKFAADFGARKLSEITVDEVIEWLSKIVNTVTRDNYRRHLFHLWHVAVKRKWTGENVIADIDRPRLPEPSRGILTVEQVARLLEHADDHGLVPYIILGTFQGIRPEELHKLDWKQVNWTERMITLESGVTKTTWRRIITLNDTTVAWLAPFVRREGPLVDAVKFREQFDALRKAAKITQWPKDGLRHSFGSYHCAMFKDITRTATEMGNSVNVVHRHYRALVTEADAKRFWSLRPDAEADRKIVPIAASA
jgi:integrase